jgi:hypothetical protein
MYNTYHSLRDEKKESESPYRKGMVTARHVTPLANTDIPAHKEINEHRKALFLSNRLKGRSGKEQSISSNGAESDYMMISLKCEYIQQLDRSKIE